MNTGEKQWRIANWVLVLLIVLVNGYILISPLLPRFDLWRRQHQAAAVSGLPYQTKLDNSSAKNKRSGPPKDNRLVIPKLAIDQHIYTGWDKYLVNKGVWARPNTSTPPEGGNTVMVAHRFTYSGPSIFYSLDKLNYGDKVVVYWDQKEYDYTVVDSQTVKATQISVESPTTDSRLTLYTCTPLWNPKDRLVVTAQLDRPPQ